MRYFTILFALSAAYLTPVAARAQDMALSGVLLDNAPWEMVAEGYQFTEGPAVDLAGNLYFTDVPANRIYKVDSAGQVSVFVENSGATNGLMFGADGRLYGCQNGQRRIVAYDSAGQAATIAEDVDSNDLVVTGAGAIYFTDPGNHRVWYVSPTGEKRIVDEGIERPNGIILWPDQGTLVVADTAGSHLWAFRVQADGSLAFKQPYYTMQMLPEQKGSGADGMTVDSAGRLYVATHAGLQMFDPTGRLGGAIAKPQRAFLSNAVFAGPDLDTLYVTCTDKVYRRKTKATGVRYFKSQAEKDLAVQGEYSGELSLDGGKQKIGVQVIAMGGGTFHAVSFMGGLPGDGGDKTTRNEGDGEMRDDAVTFTTDRGAGRIAGGVLTLSDPAGNKLGELKRVERASSTLGMKPPEGAVVLFDGSSADAFEGGRMTDDKLLIQGVTSKQKFGDCTLHLEFRTPYMPEARGQGRGNSGCYLQGRFETQILDSFGLEGKDNECGGIYSIRDPDVNMCFPPLAWQTYDVDYTAARFDAAGAKTQSARITVRHNGVSIHENVELTHATTAAPVAEGPDKGPLYLQDHGNPVRFKNIWLIER